MAENLDPWIEDIFSQLNLQARNKLEVLPDNSTTHATGLRVFKVFDTDATLNSDFNNNVKSRPKNASERIYCYLILTVALERGGSFSEDNLAILYKFFNLMRDEGNSAPLIFYLNSGGVRVHHARTIFDSIWGVIRELLMVKRQRVLITVGDRHVLGAAAVFFAQGHFRIAATPETLINLTGPGIIHQFFGQAENYHQYACADHQIALHLLVHEQTTSIHSALGRVAQFLTFVRGETPVFSLEGVFQRGDFSLGEIPTDLLSPCDDRQKAFLRSFANESMEILPSHSGPGQCYLIRRSGRILGLMMNPISHSSNLIDHKMIEKYHECLNLFKALKLPLVIFTDTPGGDPRKKNSDFNILKKTVALVEDLIDYPFGRVGFIAGRCFGGSGMLALPQVHNSWGLYALKGSKIGVMADEIITQMVDKNPKSKAEWIRTQAGHSPDLSDLVKEGTIRKVISLDEVGSILDLFLKAFPLPQLGEPQRRGALRSSLGQQQSPRKEIVSEQT
ncbi:MAG: hypothetical protein IPK04_07175 [Bdellovibrionales bacterium]|nr:hypothetical protein [Bdellovibrionales bacterium]